MTTVDPSTLPVLRKGNSGEYVRFLQQLLVAAGEYGPSRVHGEFDQETEDAVSNFQQSHGIDVDGVVGEDTWPSLVPFWSPPTEEPEVVIDMEPMVLGPSLGRLPTREDAEAGRAVLETSLAVSARRAAHGYAELFVRWDSDWQPNEAGIEMITQLWDTASALKEGPIEFFKEVGVTTTQFVVDLFMDGAYAKYRGEASRVRKEFYESVANGAAAALTGTSGRPRRTTSLPRRLAKRGSE